MTTWQIDQLIQGYDDEQDSDVHIVQQVVDLGLRFMTRADIEEDFNVNQDFITAALEYQPYI